MEKIRIEFDGDRLTCKNYPPPAIVNACKKSILELHKHLKNKKSFETEIIKCNLTLQQMKLLNQLWFLFTGFTSAMYVNLIYRIEFKNTGSKIYVIPAMVSYIVEREGWLK